MNAPSRTGVLLINLGTPQAPTAGAVRRFLREFLSDPRVVEVPRAIWLPVLYALVLPLKPRRTTRMYRKIWMDEGSPLLVHTQRQARALDVALKQRAFEATVEIGMCYGQPSITAALTRLMERDIARLVALPLYPQYSATTTAAAFDAISQFFRKRRRMPELHFIRDFHDNDAYIKACVSRVRDSRAERGAAERLLFSFHGLPERNVQLGDPYRAQCEKTAERIAHELGLGPDRWLLSFQSRFGRAEWLRPYTDETLQALARRGVRSVEVFCPGFAADCLETLEEINIRNRSFFLEAGGERFDYIPALNDTAEFIECLANLVTGMTTARRTPETAGGDNR